MCQEHDWPDSSGSSLYVRGTSPLGQLDRPTNRGTTGLRVHTIQNDNPYLGLDPTREGNGKYPIIFEPLQNVQMSRSTYKVTSFIDFEPYLRYFTNFKRYLNKFLQEIVNFMEDPVFREFRWGSPTAREGDAGIDCSQQPKCKVQLPLFQVRNQNARMEAYQQQRERCVARHFQVCLRSNNLTISLTYPVSCTRTSKR